MNNIKNVDSISHPGIYVYRNNRLIKCDDKWEYADNRSKHGSQYCARVSIKLDESWDEDLGLDPQKTSYEFPRELKDKITAKLEEKRPEWAYKGKATATFF